MGLDKIGAALAMGTGFDPAMLERLIEIASTPLGNRRAYGPGRRTIATIHRGIVRPSPAAVIASRQNAMVSARGDRRAAIMATRRSMPAGEHPGSATAAKERRQLARIERADRKAIVRAAQRRSLDARAGSDR